MNEISNRFNYPSIVPATTRPGADKRKQHQDQEPTSPTPTNSPAISDDGPVFSVSLSDEVQTTLLENSAIPGKSKAHEARVLLAEEEYEALGNMPFGKVVSALARGVDIASLLPSQEVTEAPEPPQVDGEGSVSGVEGESLAGQEAPPTPESLIMPEDLIMPENTQTLATPEADLDTLTGAEAALSLLLPNEEEEREEDPVEGRVE